MEMESQGAIPFRFVFHIAFHCIALRTQEYN